MVLANARYQAAEKKVVRLWQLVALCAALYSLLHYPLMAPMPGSAISARIYEGILVAWLISIAAGGLCFWIPSLAALPPAFLLWCNAVCGLVTGLPSTTDSDIQPLTEVSVCIGLGLLINQVYSRCDRSSGTIADSSITARASFANLLFLLAISVHLANYFWSFYAKSWLDGPWGAWIAENNPAYIFLVALDDGHILYSGYPRLVEWVYTILNSVYRYANVLVLSLQGAAIAAFFLPKWAFLTLLLLFDVLHFSIMFTVGAYFWPWIILNAVIVVVAAEHELRLQPLASRLVATCFILAAPLFVRVTFIGWYDSGANNKLYFEAVDDSGKRHAVPANFFTFYSYFIGHMDYGAPDPASAFAVGSPNGGVHSYGLFHAGRSCDVAALTRRDGDPWAYREKLTAFVRSYHQLALTISSRLGAFPYEFYPHHFYTSPSESQDFDLLDKRRIVAYAYRRELVCLSFGSGGLQRRVISSAEYQFDVNGRGDETRLGSE